ncbi:MAG TPA: hypothetical protein PK971_16300 [Saprospiraceae bacterium]|nr:hypothetical protein [Saprospiraceae bacterium]HND89895.1 hypothetical protein [Saprospiraceae bacterium]HNG91050.1 hypothetical protein [Saprospiraceae bacterium]HNM20604.1 hypothetical protein [Nitrospira sp.]
MKSLLTLALAALFQIATATVPQPLAASFAPCQKVILNAGTLVILETNEALQSGQATVGQLVQFKVRANVYAEGEVAISTGAQAIGRIKAIEPATHNDPETFKIEVMYVQAVDGQQVALNGNELSIKGQFPGQSAGSLPGTTLTATVMNDTKIKV